MIVVSEAWAEAGEPSASARLAGARALIDLLQLDRAWVRLKGLVERDPPNVNSVALAAEMFILRGWPNQARKVLQRGMDIRPDDDGLQELWDRAAEGPTEPEWVDQEAASPAELVRQAEQYMARGSLVRAQGLLERVRRAEPTHARAGDLLWGLEGDYAGRDGRSVAQLVAQQGLCDNTLADLEDDAEHTESANLADLPLQLERDEDVRFPSLFRNLSSRPIDPDGGEPEVTAVTSMADLADAAREDSETTGPAAHADDDGGSCDTKIMRVVHKQGPASLDGEPAHVAAPRIDRSFDLAEFRREFGMTHAASFDTDYTAGPEDEDDSVIILTRREEEPQEAVDTTDAGNEEGPLTLDTAAEAEACKLKGAIEDDIWAKPTPKRDRHDDDKTAPPGPRPPPSASSRAPERAPQRKSLATTVPRPQASRPQQAQPPPPSVPLEGGLQVGTWPWWVALFGALLALGVLAFAVIALVAALQ